MVKMLAAIVAGIGGGAFCVVGWWLYDVASAAHSLSPGWMFFYLLGGAVFGPFVRLAIDAFQTWRERRR